MLFDVTTLEKPSKMVKERREREALRPILCVLFAKPQWLHSFGIYAGEVRKL